MPPPPYRGKDLSLGFSQRRVLSRPEDDFDPYLEACFPVLYDTDEESPTWEPLPIKLIKELKQACSSYGATAPYTLTLLDALAARWMIPYDWRAVAKACLSGGQYLLWRTEYEDLAHKQARDNYKYGPKHIVQEMLAGINEFQSVRDQMNFDRKALEQVTACALGAWRSLPQGKELTSSLSDIKQKPEKQYEDFVSRLIEGIHRVIPSDGAAEILIKQLAFDNADSICQTLLRPIRKSGDIGEYIKQCADVGPAMM